MTTLHTQQIRKDQHGISRPPVVVVLGHVDHGKSSLLEAIREDFRITQRESGGITQHIGAYQAEYADKKITFLDTPGHELFSTMRSRGVKMADIGVLVVAGDESVKPQTVEAIEQAKKAGIPLVVAITKIDKPSANSQRVKQELAQHGVVVESYGGDVPSVETSAITKQGIKELLEMILLMAEIEGVKADQEKPGKGVVIEASLDPRRGPAATLLMQQGELRVGDLVGTNTTAGKIRILEDFQGNSVQVAFPSMPALAIGFPEPPRIGEEFCVLEHEETVPLYRRKRVSKGTRLVLIDPKVKVVNVVVKVDVAGSLEALEEVFKGLPQEKVAIRLVESGVGDVKENDVKLAHSSRAQIFGFRVNVTNEASAFAERENIPIHRFDVIYELIQAVRELQENSVTKEEPLVVAKLVVLTLFGADKKGEIVGGRVLEGEIHKGMGFQVVRGGEIVGHGKVANVQHERKTVSSVQEGKECGLLLETREKVQEGDHLIFLKV